MTSTLVGSEMCIRDRLSVTTQVQNETSNPEWLRVEQLRFNTHLRAVSYTHLTLPTICSV
eukprot:1302247-Prorocentrum_lima.AAC.1